MSSIDVNLLNEIFGIICDLCSVLIAASKNEPFLQSFLNFATKINQAILMNLEENEFEEVSEFELEILKNQNAARINSNLACFYSKFFKDLSSSEYYA